MKILILSFTSYLVFASTEIVFVRQNSAPKYSQNTQHNGLCDLVYTELKLHLDSKKIPAKILTTNFPIKRILKMLDANEANVFCGASKTEDRVGKLIYSNKPVYSVSNVLITHKENLNFPKNLQELKSSKFKVGSFYGTASSQFIKNFIGKKVSDQITSLDEAAKLVGQKRLDFFFYHDLGLIELVNNTKYPVKIVPLKYRSVDQYLLFNKNIPQNVVDEINAKLNELYESKKINEIWSKYLYLDN